MTEAHHSGCPVNLPLEVFGDEWSLLILRDMVLPSLAAAIRCAIVGSVWRVLPIGGIISGLEQVMDSVVLETIVKSERPTVEAQEGQPEPVVFGRPVSYFGIAVVC